MIKQIAKTIIKWFVISGLFKFPRKIIGRFNYYIISLNKGYLTYYENPESIEVIDLIRKIKDEKGMMLRDNEAYQIFRSIKQVKDIDGDMVEVGCFNGGSSKLIIEANKKKTLHLFDTFEGLPGLTNDDDDTVFREGKYSARMDDVKDYLKEYDNINFYKGVFPTTSGPIENKRFSFVHLDVDLYEGTLESLKFFYPRMNAGGIIISHDYLNPLAPGVKKAFDEFFKDKTEPVIEMSGCQCLVVKTSCIKSTHHEVKA